MTNKPSTMFEIKYECSEALMPLYNYQPIPVKKHSPNVIFWNLINRKV